MTTNTTDPRVARTRHVVLEATVDVIARQGFGGATIDAIATRSGVARSTIYRNWDGRTELLLEAVRSRFAPLRDTIVGNLRRDLLALSVRLADLLTNEPMASVAASLILESRRDPELRDLHRRFVEGRMREIVDVVEEARARGDLSAVPDGRTIAIDLGAPIFFRALVLQQRIEKTWLETHVDAVCERHGVS